MIPEPGRTLNDIAVRLATRLLPEIASTFGQADAGIITSLLMTLAQDFERAVDNRMTDIQEMRALFAAAETAPGAPERDAFAQATPASLRLADVNALHARGFELLIALHAWAEDHDADLDRRIWQLLRAHSERNKFDIPGP